MLEPSVLDLNTEAASLEGLAPKPKAKSKAKAKSKGELKEIANCCNVLGELYQQQGKYEDAISEHEVNSLN